MQIQVLRGVEVFLILLLLGLSELASHFLLVYKRLISRSHSLIRRSLITRFPTPSNCPLRLVRLSRYLLLHRPRLLVIVRLEFARVFLRAAQTSLDNFS